METGTALTAPGGEWRGALRLWWSFAWRQAAYMAALTIGLSLVGWLWITLGLSSRAFAALSPLVFLALVLLAQVDTFRRLIRLYGIRAEKQ